MYKNLKKQKKAIVFGGSGFLGSHLCDVLSDDSFIVTIFDVKKSKYLREDQKFILGNINNYKQVEKAIKKNNYVFNFAGVSDIDEANQRPLKAINYNIIGTVNILEAIKKKSVKIFIFASSIYSRSKQGGFYSTTKRTCESLIEDYSSKYKIKFTILRFGSLYGTRANNFNAILGIIRDGINNGKIIRKTSGKEIRNYINVKDAAKICVKILKKKYANQYYNIMGKEKMTVRKIINLISKKTSTKKIIYQKSKLNNIHYKMNPFTYKVKEAKFLNIKNSIKLEQGIQEIIDSYSK